MQLPRLRQQPQNDQSFEIPNWQCHCCQDTGLVSVNALRRLDPEYSIWTHAAIACNRRGCHKEAPKYALEALSPAECEEIHQYERQGWLESAKAWAENPERHAQVVAQMSNYLGKPPSAIAKEPEYLEF